MKKTSSSNSDVHKEGSSLNYVQSCSACADSRACVVIETILSHSLSAVSVVG